jgi:AcrR family transcriptional regulator
MASKIRDRIIDQAIRCFAERGYSGCSTKEISVRADVTEGSLFRLFGSKNKLFEEALARVWSQTLPQEKFENLLNSGGLEQGVQRAFRAMYKKLSVAGVRMVGFAMLENTDHTRETVVPLHDVRVRSLAKRLRRAIEEGEARKNINPNAEAAAIYLCTRAMNYDSRIMKRSKNEHLRLVEKFVSLWLRGILK